MNHEVLERDDPLVELKKLVKDVASEIPDEMLHGTEGGVSKARKNWWMAVTGNVFDLIGDNRLSGNLLAEAEDFAKTYTQPAFHMRLTTKEDIETANKLMAKIFKALG